MSGENSTEKNHLRSGFFNGRFGGFWLNGKSMKILFYDAKQQDF